MESVTDLVRLVDIDGNDVPLTEKHDIPWDPWADPIWDWIRIELGPRPDFTPGFIPTPEDWADYRAAFDAQDERTPPEVLYGYE